MNKVLIFFLVFYLISKIKSDQDTETTTKRIPTPAEKYGYGTIAIVIISLIALIGIIILPCFKKSYFENVLMAFTSLAIGTLLCDTLFHILPEVYGLEAHSEDNHDKSDRIEVPDYATKILVTLGVLYLSWLVEILLSHFTGRTRENGHNHGHSHGIQMEDDQFKNNKNKIAPIDELETQNKNSVELSVIENQSTSDSEEKNKKNSLKSFFLNLKRIKATGWMILAGDAIHNLADGLAVGASFSESINLGISTSIAVFCHEIPHELGNYAVLLKCGFTHIQALIFNLISAMNCLIGFYIGASVSTDGEVSRWIFTITAGIFLYISLVELLPTVMATKNWSWVMFIVCNICMIIGFAIMFLLVIFESHIKV